MNHGTVSQFEETAFLPLTGCMVAVPTLEASRVRPVGRREITHARELAIA